MTTIFKKQISITLLMAVFATIMIAGTIASVTDNSAFAFRNHFFNHHHHNGSHSSTSQSISQSCNQNQHSTVLTAGAGSPIIGSGNNIAACTNINGGGNAAATN
jgi:hypothetical protein